MKSVIAFLLAALMLLCLAACGTEAELTGQVADIFNAGYEVSMTTSTDSEIQVILENPETESHIALTAPADSKLIDKFNKIDILDEDYDKEIKAFLCGLDPVTLEELDSLVPAGEQLAAFNGMTVAELEAEGYELWGYSWGDGTYTMTFDNGTIVMSFTVADPDGIENPDDASNEQLGALVISGAEFHDISDCYFDNN